MAAPEVVTQALQTYTEDLRHEDAERAKLAEAERAEILARFPISAWPQMTLEQYALGQEDSTNTFCRWLEFRSPHLGSFQCGSAQAHHLQSTHPWRTTSKPSGGGQFAT